MKNTTFRILPSAILLCFGLLIVPNLHSAESETAKLKQTELSVFEATVLGIVEGLTEYLPVSSTGHLILTAHFMGLSNDTILIDQQGSIVFLEKPSEENPNGTPLTLKAGIDAYSIIIQFGAIAAVVIIYWKRLLEILFGVLGKNRTGRLLLRNLILAFIPAAVIGLSLEKLIDKYLFGPGPVVIALFVGGLLILAVNRWHDKNANDDDSPELHELTIKQCLFIGGLQCLAMWPGTSRSLMTIVGGYLVRLSPTRAAEFSFLLGLVTLSAASIYKGYQVGEPLVDAFGMGTPLLGCLVAAISAAVAVKWMVNYLGKHGLAIFGYYRIVLSIALAVVFYF